MALFIGGPVDGSRVSVPSHREYIDVPVNPMPPAFTPDSDVLNTRNAGLFRYKRESITCGNEVMDLFVPTDWDCSIIISNLVNGYGVDKMATRLEYLNRNEGTLYDNDDRVQAGRAYQLT